MRPIILFITLTLCVLSSSLCFAEQIFWGIEYWQENVTGGSRHDYDDGKPNKLFIMKVDLKAKGIRPYVTPDLNGGRKTTSQFVSDYGVQVGINTAFFDMGGSNKSIGYFSSNGTPYTSNIKNDDYPTIGFTQANEFLRGIENRPKMYNALSGIYHLVIDGEAQIYANYDVAPRTVAGIDKSGRYFYMIVNDGRSSASAGMTLSQIGKHMARLGVWYGINLDGGGSSTMVIAGRGAVNRPSDGSQRLVSSHLGFFADANCTPSEEVCNGVDDNCNGTIDEDGICNSDADPMYQSMIYDNQNTDVDGDGKADICARGGAGIYCAFSKSGDLTNFKLVLPDMGDDKGWNDVSNYGTIRFADYNGDGLADICGRDDEGVRCWISTGDGFGAPSEYVKMADGDKYNDVIYYSTIRFADINGDGRDDMCARFNDGFKCYPAKDNGWGDPIPTGDMADNLGWAFPRYYTTIRTGDINGDGKVDICGRGGRGFRCWLSEGDKFAPDFLAAPWSDGDGWTNPVYYQSIRMADINGDHQMDVCARDADGIVCYPSQGTIMGDPVRGPGIANVHGWNDHDNYSTFRTGDVNGDGRDDFCIRGNANLACYLSQGEGYFATNIDDFKNENGWTSPDHYRTIRMGDVNGDGKMDICGKNADGVKCYSYNGSGYDVIDGPGFKNSEGWSAPQYYSTLRIGGPIVKACSRFDEVCDGKDNNCNGQVDENNVCCVPAEEICDGQDNDCNGEIDEGLNCCVPAEEICDGQDNNCNGEIDEGLNCCVPADEICDGQDNDCNGEIDEGLNCDQPTEEICDGIDNDGDGEIDEDLNCCIPTDEICDNIDNDCDGETDEGDVCNGNDNGENNNGDGENNNGDGDNSDNPDDARQSASNLYADEDCGCSVKNSHSTPNALLGLFLVGGLVCLRRRRS